VNLIDLASGEDVCRITNQEVELLSSSAPLLVILFVHTLGIFLMLLLGLICRCLQAP
jgi:hypothetical protein